MKVLTGTSKSLTKKQKYICVCFKKPAGPLGRRVFSRSAGLKLLTTFCWRLRSGEGDEARLKHFSLGGFACKRQLPRQAEGPGSPQLLPSPLRHISWQSCHGDATVAHSSTGNNWLIQKFLARFSASPFLSHTHPHPQSQQSLLSRRNPRQGSGSKQTDPAHTPSIFPSSYLLGDYYLFFWGLFFFFFSQAGLITTNV